MRADSVRRPDRGGRGAGMSQGSGSSGRQTNVGNLERIASLAAGALLLALGARRRSLPGLLVAGAGGAMLARGATGRSQTYRALQLDTSRSRAEARRGVRVERSVLIQRPADALYRHWRDLENLPRILSHLEQVTVSGDRRSHWVADAPRLAGGRIEWDAEITADEPGVRIAWRALPGGDIDTSGEVRFAPARGDRGTALRVVLEYRPPAGDLADRVARLTGGAAEQRIRDDLRRFKRVMETGELVTIEGQPHGRCGRLGRLLRG